MYMYREAYLYSIWQHELDNPLSIRTQCFNFWLKILFLVRYFSRMFKLVFKFLILQCSIAQWLLQEWTLVRQDRLYTSFYFVCMFVSFFLFNFLTSCRHSWKCVMQFVMLAYIKLHCHLSFFQFRWILLCILNNCTRYRPWFVLAI